MRILVVEDHADIAHQILEKLRRSGYPADVASSIDDAFAAIESNSYSLALLDRKLPDGDGLSLISDMRKAQPGIRVVILTALDGLDETIAGLDAGADDYLKKPFAPDELVARIRACLRRPGGESGPKIHVGNLSFDPATREAFVDGDPLIIPFRELTLLDALTQRAGRVVLRETLMSEVFGGVDKADWNSLNVLVWQLRNRLKDADATADIRASRRIGYYITRSDK